jgi:hypothetical protein
MAFDLIKFLYITKKFDLFSFVDKLIQDIDLYDEVAYQAIRSLQVYSEEKHPDRFSLRMEVTGKTFTNQLEKVAQHRPDKPFPRVCINDEKVIFIPARINKERMMACDLNEQSATWGSVLKVKDDSFTSMHKFIKFVKTELKEFGVNSVAKMNDSYIVGFLRRDKAEEAKKKLKAKRIRVTNSDLCLAATNETESKNCTRRSPDSTRQVKRSDVRTQEEPNEIKTLKKEVQSLRLELEEMKEEVSKLKDKMKDKKEAEKRAVSAVEHTDDIRITTTFPTPVNNYMAFMPIQPSTSNGLWGYMYASEGSAPCKKVKYD